jgi:hypothetical protein
MFIIFHVDDILLSFPRTRSETAAAFKKAFLHRFTGRDEGVATRYIGLDITRTDNMIHLSQSALVRDLLEDFGMSECTPVKTPMAPGTRLTMADRPVVPHLGRTKIYQSLVGSFQYLAVWTRPDICYVTHQLARHMCNPGEAHLAAAYYALQYLKGTIDQCITYTKGIDKSNTRFGFSDSDWAADTETRKSLGAHVFMCNGGPVAWRCKQQTGIATSTAEAEYMAASKAAQEAVWLGRLMQGMGYPQERTTIYEDNRACILMSENPINRDRSRHVDVSVHNVRDLCHRNVVRLLACPTQDMLADVLTKALPAPAFLRHRAVLLGQQRHTAPAFRCSAVQQFSTLV